MNRMPIAAQNDWLQKVGRDEDRQRELRISFSSPQMRRSEARWCVRRRGHPIRLSQAQCPLTKGLCL